MGFCFRSCQNCAQNTLPRRKNQTHCFVASPCLLQCLLADNAGDKLLSGKERKWGTNIREKHECQPQGYVSKLNRTQSHLVQKVTLAKYEKYRKQYSSALSVIHEASSSAHSMSSQQIILYTCKYLRNRLQKRP